MLSPKASKQHLELRFRPDCVRMLDDLCKQLNMRRSEVLMALVQQEWTAQHRLRSVNSSPA